MKRFIVLGAGVLVVLAASAFVLAHQENEGSEKAPYTTTSREFTISPRSDVASIQIERWGGNTIPPKKSTTSMYGDDRLAQTVVHTYEAARSLDAAESVQLAHEDTRSLVKIATEGGLIGLSWADLQRKISPARGRAGKMHDASWLRIRYQLDAYGDTGAAVDFTFECRCVPGVLRHRYPEVPEVVALHNLLLRMKELREKGAAL